MKQLYLFMMSVVALGALLLGSPAQAQPYVFSNYLVRANADPWTEIQGTQIPELLAGGSDFNYYYVSNSIATPFPIHFLNNTFNSIRVGANGEVICSTTWPDGLGDFSAFDGYNEMQVAEQDFPSFGEGFYPDWTIHAWSGGFQGLCPSSDYQYATLGVAPNRQFVIQTRNKINEDADGHTGSWQVVIYESGISTFQLNYGPSSNPSANWNGPFGYTVVTGLKGNSTYFQANADVAIATSPQPAVGNSPTVAYSTMYNNVIMPTVNYKIFIAYPYDFSANSITNPADQSIILKDAPQTPRASLTNQGSSRPTTVNVSNQITIAGASSPVYAQTTTLIGAAVPVSFASTTVSWPTFTPTSYGIYEDTVIITSLAPTNDQFIGNNMTTAEFIVSPPNNIKAIAVTNPARNSRTPINVNTPIGARFKNLGSNAQFGVPISAYITDPSGQVVYRDTVIIPSWPSGKVYDTTFRDWIPSSNGVHTICIASLMTTDQLHADDIACGQCAVRYETDVATTGIFNPQTDEEKPFTKLWKPTGMFQSVGVSDLFDVPVRVQIRRCSDNALVFQADSTMPELNVDQGSVKFSFPTKQGNFDIAKILPGCYTQCVIAKYPTDGDRTNDTSCTTFSIIDRLKGDINVGVGQRFQTLHAAVDSLKYRGVGGNLRLILTDATYSENGSDAGASSPNGFLDFSGITGVSDAATITFMPKPGVKPTITFTGNKPSCFYFGYHSPNYVTFDGMSLLGVPPPDSRLVEPNKRNMTIVNNSTAAGSVFALEFGAHHMALRNMKLMGNGKFNNDSSSVVRMYHDQNQGIYLSGVRDTLPVHDNLIENNELGNAKYGVWDRGVHDLFNIGPPTLFLEHRNFSNTITRNTIGTSASPLGYAGVSFDNEKNTTISHNEIAWVNSVQSGQPNAYGIVQAGVGNATGMWIDANKVHNVAAPTSAYGLAIQQSATIYTNGTGVNQQKSTLPVTTNNRATNNMLYDLRSASTYPLVYLTFANSYFTSGDSVFNNSISVSKAAVDVYIAQTAKAFVWNNVIQNFGQGGAAYTNYYFAVPRPFAGSISSDYNLFDLRGNSIPFATVNEYDQKTGNFIQTRSFRRFNDWRTYTHQDVHSITADPMFSSDSLHMPSALSYVASPASNNGAWLGSATQMLDFDGDQRLAGNLTPDIGADEFDGFQFSNDLAVMAIYKPAGYSRNSDTTFISTENPVSLEGVVKNLSSQAVFGRTVNAILECAIAPGTWTTIWTGSSTALNFDVNETKQLDWTGPMITPVQESGVFRFTVSVPGDQNNANNSQVKLFKVLVKHQALLVSYESSTAKGLRNRDSVTAALRRLGVAFDTINRTNYGSIDLDYTPWWTLVWSQGDPSLGLNANPSLGIGALSLKETEELSNYLRQGQPYGKKSLVIAGQNIAYYNDFGNVNSNSITDTQFTHQMLHSKFLARTPVAGGYNNFVKGGIPVYFTFSDSLNAASPNVIARTIITPTVAPEVTGVAYSYLTHPAYAADSGAGVAYYGPSKNTVFFAFDWADLAQTTPSEAGILTSGTTRALRGALDFIQSTGGTALPVEFVSIKGERNSANTANVITWKTASQKDVASFAIEQQDGSDWAAIGNVGATQYAFTHTGIDCAKAYTYRVIAIDLNGTRKESQTVTVAGQASAVFGLEQNYPNPFNPTTTVGFALPTGCEVTLKVLDVTGNTLMTILNAESMTAGAHTVTVNAEELASGTYVYQLVARQANGEQIVLTRKMVLNK